MCGIAALLGRQCGDQDVLRALGRIQHRGPDSNGLWTDEHVRLTLGHARLRIIDLSDAGAQPMASADGRWTIAFNGEVYNYIELREELNGYPFRSQTDTEVVLAAWARWGTACLDKLTGMFAFVIWDRLTRRLTAVRDRFGIKPLYWAELPDGALALASEIKALHAMGLPVEPDPSMWSSFFCHGITDQAARTFWRGAHAIEAGHVYEWNDAKEHRKQRWYDLAVRVGQAFDPRSENDVKDEYRALLHDSVNLRFRADVPVGINLSGGIDSSLLLSLVDVAQRGDRTVRAFTFTTGDPAYDELPWVRGMIEQTHHPLTECRLDVLEVPTLAREIADAQDEPFGGLPTLAYAKLFRTARQDGVIVLLDAQGMDEQWAGYDYYAANRQAAAPKVQGACDPATRPDCLDPDFASTAAEEPLPSTFSDRLRNLQERDIRLTKLPRALRYNDRVSMAASTELREPFLDHRLVELALRQPEDRKRRGVTGKWLLREIARELVPASISLAPKRPLQTPQREWLRGPLHDWADSMIESALATHDTWFDAARARAAWSRFHAGAGDNSYWVWQWLSLGLLASR